MKQMIAAACLMGFAATAGFAQSTDEAAEETTDVVVAEQAQQRIANGTQFGAWTVTCEALAVNETACVLTQRLVRSSDNAFLAELLAFWSGDGSRSYLAARVPNGVFFPSGFAFKPEESEEQQQFVWQSCARDLCEALLEVDMETVKGLEAAESLIAGYRPSLQSEPLVFRMTMDGAEEGLMALKASME